MLRLQLTMATRIPVWTVVLELRMPVPQDMATVERLSNKRTTNICSLGTFVLPLNARLGRRNSMLGLKEAIQKFALERREVAGMAQMKNGARSFGR